MQRGADSSARHRRLVGEREACRRLARPRPDSRPGASSKASKPQRTMRNSRSCLTAGAHCAHLARETVALAQQPRLRVAAALAGSRKFDGDEAQTCARCGARSSTRSAGASRTPRRAARRQVAPVGQKLRLRHDDRRSAVPRVLASAPRIGAISCRLRMLSHRRAP